MKRHLNTPRDQARFPQATQSRQPLGRALERDVQEQIDATVDPESERIDELEEQLATGVFVSSADVELVSALAGEFFLEGRFAENQVGAPVIVTLSGDVDELALIVFAASCVDRRRIRVRYISSSPAPRRLRVNFILGVTS